MSKLVVLTEIDCLDLLRRKGIHPEEYFTDFEKFKNRASFFEDVIVVCIMAGTCQFSKRHILEFCTTLSKRSRDDFDTGIKDLYILSDTVLPNCKSYYLYRELPIVFSQYSGWKCRQKEVRFWEKLEYEQSNDEDCQCYYSEYDRSETTRIMKSLETRFSELDELIGLIKIPQIGNVTE